MKNLKKGLLILITVNNIFLSSGCWNYREINSLGIVAGFAVDKDPKTNHFILTTEVIDTLKRGEGEVVGSRVYQTEGETVFDAVRDILIKKSEKSYFAHTKVLIVSKQIAESGDIVPIIDFINRDPEMREDMKLLVSHKETAGQILNRPGKRSDDIISFTIEQAVRYEKFIAKYPTTDVWEFIDELAAEGSSPFVPSIDTSVESDKEVFRVFGGYAFKKQKAVAWLNSLESRAAKWFRNEIKGGIMQVQIEAEGVKSRTDLEMFGSKTKIKPITKDEKLIMNVYVEIEAGIASLDGKKDNLNAPNRQILQKEAEQKVRNDMYKVLNMAQKEFKSDIFGFSGAVQRELPGEWKKIKKNWNEEFENLQVNIDVKVNLIGSATSPKPIKIGE